MNDNQSRLVEAFKIFMSKSVIPALPQNHHSLNEWKFLDGILCSNPIDFGQLDFYLHMVNKNSSTPPPMPLNKTQSS
jgi:hypothetical protein